MSTPTEKPVDRVSVSLSQSDFCRLVSNALASSGAYGILNAGHEGRIEVLDITTLLDDEREGWIIDTLFIPRDGS